MYLPNYIWCRLCTLSKLCKWEQNSVQSQLHAIVCRHFDCRHHLACNYALLCNRKQPLLWGNTRAVCGLVTSSRPGTWAPCPLGRRAWVSFHGCCTAPKSQNPFPGWSPRTGSLEPGWMVEDLSATFSCKLGTDLTAWCRGFACKLYRGCDYMTGSQGPRRCQSTQDRWGPPRTKSACMPLSSPFHFHQFKGLLV